MIEASNGHKRPRDLSVFLPLLSPAVTLAHTLFVFFCHVYPPPSPPRLVSLPISLRGTVISLFLRWIGFSAAVTSMEAVPPPGFCHLSKTRCHFHSPSHPSPLCLLILASLLLSLTGQSCVFVSVCGGASCVIPILCSQNRFSLRFGASWKHFCQHQPSIFISPLPSYLLCSLYDTFPFRSPLSNQENMMQKRAENTFSDISCDRCRVMLKERGICILFQCGCVRVLLERARLSHESYVT